MSSEGSSSTRRRGNPAGAEECNPHFSKGVPNFFGPRSLPKNNAPAQQRHEEEAPSEKLIEDQQLAKNTTTQEEIPVAKKQRVGAPAPSLSNVYKTFGQLGESSITEADLKWWLAKPEEEKQKAATKAAVKLFLFHTERERNNNDILASIEALEAENAKLKKENKYKTTKIKKLQADKKVVDELHTALSNDKARLEKKLDDKKSALREAKFAITTLKEEIAELKEDQANGWADEKKRIQDKGYEDGFKSFCRAFVAGDPTYDWASKFGKEMATWIADFSKKEAKGIALKRAELEKILVADHEE